MKFNTFEKWWLGIFLGLIGITTIYFSYGALKVDNSISNIILNVIISPVSAVTGVLCVVYTAKKHVVSYAFGIVNCITYGYLAYKIGFYGDFMINIFYFLPFQFIGFKWWKNHHIETDNNIVKSRNFTLKQLLVVTVVAVFGWVIFTNILAGVDHFVVNALKRNASMYDYFTKILKIPYIGEMLDSSTEVFQFIAQFLLSFGFAEQWIFWILTNFVSIFMWSLAIYADPTTASFAIPSLITWIAFLVNSFYGLYKWYKKDV